MKTCPLCKKTFIPKNYKQTICGDWECYSKFKRIRARKKNEKKSL